MQIDLPPPDTVHDTYKVWHFSIDGEREAVTCPADEIHVSGIGQFTRTDAHAFALALLAAVAATDPSDTICADCHHVHSGAGTALEWTHGPCFCGCAHLT